MYLFTPTAEALRLVSEAIVKAYTYYCPIRQFLVIVFQSFDACCSTCLFMFDWFYLTCVFCLFSYVHCVLVYVQWFNMLVFIVFYLSWFLFHHFPAIAYLFCFMFYDALFSYLLSVCSLFDIATQGFWNYLKGLDGALCCLFTAFSGASLLPNDHRLKKQRIPKNNSKR